MSFTGLRAFDTTVEKAHVWLKELQEDLGWTDDRQRAYMVLRAVLHVLRDRLTVDEAAHLGAQLPMLVRGFYYEGWTPSGKPLRQRSKDEFLASVREGLAADSTLDPEEAVRGVFRLLDRRITAGEIADIRGNMPQEIRDLWPQGQSAR